MQSISTTERIVRKQTRVFPMSVKKIACIQPSTLFKKKKNRTGSPFLIFLEGGGKRPMINTIYGAARII